MRTILILGLGILAATDSASGERKLEFPHDRQCGIISLGPAPSQANGFVNFPPPDSAVGPAIGEVFVPEDAFLHLSLSRQSAEDASCLKKVPTDAIGKLEVTGLQLDSDAFEALSHFEALRCLSVRDCSIAPATDLARVASPPRLQRLHVSSPSIEDIDALLEWAAGCPKLEYIYDSGGFFNADQIKLFSGHSTVSFLSAHLGSDATQVIEALAEVPDLRGLNVRVESDADEGCGRALPSLENLELINWFGGTIDSALLKSLGELPKLRVLRLQGGVELAADFPDGLRHLKRLEALQLPYRRECSEVDLNRALVGMNSLKRVPTLIEPGKDVLAMLGEREDLQAITIDMGDAEFATEDIVNVLNSATLESVDLVNVPMTSAIAKTLARCPELKTLSLNVDRLDGTVFQHPDEFAKLKRLHLNIDQSATGLDVIGRLPVLSNLSIFSNCYSVRPEAFAFVAHCKLLTSLSLHGPYVDDRIAEWICASGRLQSVRLGPNCVLTDRGVEKLAKCKSLTSLQIGGFLNRDSLEQLKQLPELLQLSISSDQLTKEDEEALRSRLASIATLRLRSFEPSVSDVKIGDDGFWRKTAPEWRAEADELEGHTLRRLFDDKLSEEELDHLAGKVVLVDFWGTWCGPCISLMPYLVQLKETYGGDGFEVLGVHTNQGLAEMDDFLRQNPKPWNNVRDTEGWIAKTFRVPHYPSLYLFDRRGELRVAKPHLFQIEHAIRTLLQEDANIKN